MFYVREQRHIWLSGQNFVVFINSRNGKAYEKNKLKYFHIHDGRENPPKNHLALGDGEIHLVERLNVARDCDARCVLETKTIEALKKSVE